MGKLWIFGDYLAINQVKVILYTLTPFSFCERGMIYNSLKVVLRSFLLSESEIGLQIYEIVLFFGTISRRPIVFAKSLADEAN